MRDRKTDPLTRPSLGDRLALDTEYALRLNELFGGKTPSYEELARAFVDMAERVDQIAIDSRETYNKVREAVHLHRPGREAKKFAMGSQKSISDAEDVFDQIQITLARCRAGCLIVKGATPIPVQASTADPRDYTLLSRTQNRARAIAVHVQETGRSMIKSDEARAYLEALEGQTLFRMQVLRALKLVPGILAGAIFEVIATGKPARVRFEGNNCASTDLDRNSLLRQRGGTGAPLG